LSGTSCQFESICIFEAATVVDVDTNLSTPLVKYALSQWYLVGPSNECNDTALPYQAEPEDNDAANKTDAIELAKDVSILDNSSSLYITTPGLVLICHADRYDEA
jgi:hypothetical protein